MPVGRPNDYIDPSKVPQKPVGPIPGENYTSNTKNYAWHRPPEITDMDKAIEASIKQLSTREGAFGVLNSLETGLTVAKAAELFVISGIGKGKWTPDFAILLAGPVAKMIEIMAKDAGIKFRMGLDDKLPPTSKYYTEKAKNLLPDTAEQAGQALQDKAGEIKAPKKATGFMGDEEE